MPVRVLRDDCGIDFGLDAVRVLLGPVSDKPYEPAAVTRVVLPILDFAHMTVVQPVDLVRRSLGLHLIACAAAWHIEQFLVDWIVMRE